jgi:hypothetical protein
MLHHCHHSNTPNRNLRLLLPEVLRKEQHLPPPPTFNPTRNSKASPSDRHLSVSSHAQNNKCVGCPHFNRPHCGFAFDDRLISSGRPARFFFFVCLGRCTANPGSVSRLRQTRWGHPPKTKMRRILHHQPPGDRCSTLTLKIHNRDFIHRRHYRLVLSSAPTPPFN